MNLLEKLKIGDKETWDSVVNYIVEDVKNNNLFNPRRTILTLHEDNPASGFFSKELVNQMIIRSVRYGSKITHMFVSEKSFEDMKTKWESTNEDLKLNKSSEEDVDKLEFTLLKAPSNVGEKYIFAFDGTKDTDQDILESVIVGSI